MTPTRTMNMPKGPKDAKNQPAEEPEDDRKATSTARLPVKLLRWARVVAAHRGIDLGDYLVSLLAATVEKDYRRIVPVEPKPEA